jgi:pentatricopeptide repeat protein
MELMEVPFDTGTYNSLMVAHVKLKSWGRVLSYWDALNSTSSLEFSVPCCWLALRACEATGNGAKAEGILAMLQSRGKVPTAAFFLAALRSSRSRTQDVDRFLRLVHAMDAQGVELTLGCFESMIDICERSLSSKESLLVLRRMIHQGHRPSQRIYNSVINTCAQSGEWQSSLRIVEFMRENNIPLDDNSLTAKSLPLEPQGRIVSKFEEETDKEATKKDNFFFLRRA